MCWYTNRPSEFDPRVAEEDISVYKVVSFNKSDECYTSLYYYHCYSIGEQYGPVKMDIRASPYYISIEDGFHSYDNECTFYFFSESLVIQKKRKERFVCTTLCSIYSLSSGPLYKLSCIIPKGTTYYVNEEGEYVSETIRIVAAYRILCVG